MERVFFVLGSLSAGAAVGSPDGAIESGRERRLCVTERDR